MKKNLLLSLIFGISIALFSCGGAETPESCAKKYCELHSKYESAATDEEKQKAKDAMNDYENELEKTHKGDEDFFKKFEEETDRICQAG